MVKEHRVNWPPSVADSILTKCHHRCCICAEHRRVSNIHHIDQNPANSVEENGVGLCGECHADVHSTSSMRRNITPDQVKLYKKNWITTCDSLSLFLQSNGTVVNSYYYMNVHRLEELFQEFENRSVFTNLPYRYSTQSGHYNSLWSNSKNSLNWTDLAQNRNYFEKCLKAIIPKLQTCDINLIELGAVLPEEWVGKLVSFACQFIGKDIPDQQELIDGLGRIDGPPPTMRRTITNFEEQSVFETCMMIDPTYMYADSSFNCFSENGIWSGIGGVIKYRDAVGSCDGPLLRTQLVISPICIGTPVSKKRISQVSATDKEPQKSYNNLIRTISQ